VLYEVGANRFDYFGNVFSNYERPLDCQLPGPEIVEAERIIEIIAFSRDYVPAVSLAPEIVARMAQYALRLDMTANC